MTTMHESAAAIRENIAVHVERGEVVRKILDESDLIVIAVSELTVGVDFVDGDLIEVEKTITTWHSSTHWGFYGVLTLTQAEGKDGDFRWPSGGFCSDASAADVAKAMQVIWNDAANVQNAN